MTKIGNTYKILISKINFECINMDYACSFSAILHFTVFESAMMILFLSEKNKRSLVFLKTILSNLYYSLWWVSFQYKKAKNV